LIAIALTVIGLLLVGPRFIDAYVDWLWFGELGYRSVFTTVLVTRLIVFRGDRPAVGGILFASLAMAYRTRPVFDRATVVIGGALSHRGDVAAAGDRHRRPGGDWLARRCCRTDLLGAYSAVPARQRFRRSRPAVRQRPRFLRLRAAVLSAVLSFFFVALFLAFVANLLAHYVFGGIRLSGRTGALSRSARIQLISLVGTLVLLKAIAYWLDRYELLSHTRAGKPFTGAGYTDINAVLPAKLILLAIALICAIAVFSAVVLRDLRDSIHRSGPAAAVVDDRRCRLAAESSNRSASSPMRRRRNANTSAEASPRPGRLTA